MAGNTLWYWAKQAGYARGTCRGCSRALPNWRACSVQVTADPPPSRGGPRRPTLGSAVYDTCSGFLRPRAGAFGGQRAPDAGALATEGRIASVHRGSVAVFRMSSTTHCPKAVWQCGAEILVPTTPRQVSGVQVTGDKPTTPTALAAVTRQPVLGGATQ